jgi:dCTP deaminase
VLRRSVLSFWTSELLLRQGWQIVYPFDRARVKECSYELSLGSEAYVTGREEETKMRLEKGEQIAIPPGQFALLLSEEKVTMRSDLIGFISLKSKFKLHALMNVSGFHVDPGFSGKLVFSVYNAGGNTFLISRGDPLSVLWVATLETATVKGTFEGPRQGQDEIMASDIMELGRAEFSPSAMDKRLSELEARVKTALAVFVGLFVAMAVVLIRPFIT